MYTAALCVLFPIVYTEIENRLIEEVDRMSTGYLLQDFRCPTTHKAAVRMCAAQSGTYLCVYYDCSSLE